MPHNAKRQNRLETRLKASNRRQIVIGLICFFVFTAILIRFDSFDLFYDYSRSHEDWELDEWIMGLIAALFTSAITFGVSTLRYNRILKQEMGYQIKLEQELAHAQKMQSLGTLAGGIAHSTNNHLQPIQTLSRLSKKQLPEDHPLQNVLDKILLSSEHAQQIIGQLLRFSHQDNREQDHCELNQTLSDNLPLFSAAIRFPAQLSLTLADQSCTVALSPSQIADIILALITNAEDSYEDQQGPIQVCLEPATHAVNLIVTDQGIGIDAEQQKRIFEPFYTSKVVGQGTGLGLAVVHGLIHQCGGHIEVQSSPGKGTRFILTLPLIGSTN